MQSADSMTSKVDFSSIPQNSSHKLNDIKTWLNQQLSSSNNNNNNNSEVLSQLYRRVEYANQSLQHAITEEGEGISIQQSRIKSEVLKMKEEMAFVEEKIKMMQDAILKVQQQAENNNKNSSSESETNRNQKNTKIEEEEATRKILFMKANLNKLQKCHDIIKNASTVENDISFIEGEIAKLSANHNNNNNNKFALFELSEKIEKVEKELNQLQVIVPILSHNSNNNNRLAESKTALQKKLDDECLSCFLWHTQNNNNSEVNKKDCAQYFTALIKIGKDNDLIQKYKNRITKPILDELNQKALSQHPNVSTTLVQLEKVIKHFINPIFSREVLFLTDLANEINNNNNNSFSAEDVFLSMVGTIEEVFFQVIENCVKTIMTPSEANETNNNNNSNCKTFLRIFHTVELLHLSDDAHRENNNDSLLFKRYTSKLMIKLTDIFKKKEIMHCFVELNVKPLSALLYQNNIKHKNKDELQKYFVSFYDYLKSEYLENIRQFFPQESFLLCDASFSDIQKQIILLFDIKPETDNNNTNNNNAVHDAIVNYLTLSQCIKPFVEKCKVIMDTFSLHNNNNNTTTPIKIVHSTEHYEKNAVLLQTILHQNESFIEKEVLQPVTACLTEYALLFTANPLHNNNNNETKNFAEGVPSAVIRTLGETIMEIPLRIETIFNQIQTNNMDEIISHFLENVIPLTLQQLVQTVLSITIRIMLVPKNSRNNAPKREGYMYIPEEEIDTDYLAGDTQTHNSKRRVVICQYYKRILNDLEYINNILSAVTDDSFDEVKNVCDALRAAMAEEDSNNNTNEIVLSVEADVKKYGKKENL